MYIGEMTKRSGVSIKAIRHYVWWGGLPAKFKGLIDCTFLSGFAFKYQPNKTIPDKLGNYLVAGQQGKTLLAEYKAAQQRIRGSVLAVAYDKENKNIVSENSDGVREVWPYQPK